MNTPINKDFKDMTLEELRAERAHWDAKIAGATHWGAALAVASEFRDACDRYIARKLADKRERTS